MTLEELKVTEEEREVLQLWELWQDEVIADAPKGDGRRSLKLAEAYYKEAGLAVTETSPLAFMFAGFLGGGTELSKSAGSGELWRGGRA